jgi:hypothetical protein
MPSLPLASCLWPNQAPPVSAPCKCFTSLACVANFPLWLTSRAGTRVRCLPAADRTSCPSVLPLVDSRLHMIQMLEDDPVRIPHLQKAACASILQTAGTSVVADALVALCAKSPTIVAPWLPTATAHQTRLVLLHLTDLIVLTVLTTLIVLTVCDAAADENPSPTRYLVVLWTHVTCHAG